MNSDKFDRVVLDLLYDELDELNTLAARRHMDQSPRARNIFFQLKAARQESQVPLHEPPADFVARVLAQEGKALSELPLHVRAGRLVSTLAGYAMRPQLAMGALLMLMLGSSLMLLRARPGQHGPVQVTERGAPEFDADRVVRVAPLAPSASPPPAPEAPRERLPAAGAEPRPGGASGGRPGSSSTGPEPDEGLEPFEQAVRLYRQGRYAEAQTRFTRLGRRSGNRAAEAALYAAQCVSNLLGCGPALERYERVRVRFPGSGPAYEAAWRAGNCSLQLGDTEAARASYESLLLVPSHGPKAERALKQLQGATSSRAPNISSHSRALRPRTGPGARPGPPRR